MYLYECLCEKKALKFPVIFKYKKSKKNKKISNTSVENSIFLPLMILHEIKHYHFDIAKCRLKIKFQTVRISQNGKFFLYFISRKIYLDSRKIQKKKKNNECTMSIIVLEYRDKQRFM